MKYLVQANHPLFRRIDAEVNTEEERNKLITDLQEVGYEVETRILEEWETYTIQITTPPETPEKFGAKEAERTEITERFETELYRLLQKYQGQADLQFKITDSLDQEIIEY